MKRIRLTEGQLHKLIEQALNELDWKTYMNAAKGAQDRIQDDPFYDEDATDADFADYNKNYSRVPDFINAARDSYQKKYGSERKDSFETYDLKDGNGINPYNYERTYGDDYGENEELPDDDFWYSQTQTFFPETEDIPDDDFTDTDLAVNSRYGEQNDWAVYDEPYRNVVDTDDRNVNLSKTSPEFRDVYNYRHGNSKYTKGKGWNESLARRVTESVVRKLNESIPIEHFKKLEPKYNEDEYPEDVLEMVQGLTYDEVIDLANREWEEADICKKAVKQFDDYYSETSERPSVGDCAERTINIQDMYNCRYLAEDLWLYATYVMKPRGFNESLARRVTESVMRRINEGCITEDCPIDDKTLQYWSELTSRNDHTQCNLSIAQYFNMPKYVDFYENLLRIRDGQGYLDGHQATKANRVYNEMMNEIANKYGEDCVNLIKRL